MWSPFRSKRSYHRHRSIKRERVASKFGSVCTLDGKTFCGNDKSLRPIIARAGGKTKLLPKIILKIPEHERFIEPFVGGGAVFLNKPKAKENIINDKDKDVIAVYKAFKNKVGFEKCNMKGSKNKYDRIKNKSKKSACDVAYLNKWSFASNTNGKRYVLAKNYYKKLKQYGKRFRPYDKDFGIKYQKAHKNDYKEKLKNTKLLNQDFLKVVKKYAKKSSDFVYADPPYVGSDNLYKEKGVTPKEVCNEAKKSKAKWMISYNDHPEVRKFCNKIKMSKVSTKHRLSSTSEKLGKELLITNF